METGVTGMGEELPFEGLHGVVGTRNSAKWNPNLDERD